MRSGFYIFILAGFLALTGSAEARPVYLFLAGDSTMAQKPPPPENPERGWGEALPYFLEKEVVVDNRALNGRSTLSYRNEGHWSNLLEDLQSGDFVLIQFGHNDQKAYDANRYAEPGTDYRKNLKQYVNEVRQRGAHPLLATSIVRRKFNEDGQLVDTHGEYPNVVREVASEMEVPLIDLEWQTRRLVQQLGDKASRKLFLHPEEGLYRRFPEGKKDDTHLSQLGATLVAQLAAQSFRKNGSTIGKYLKSPIPDFKKTNWIELRPKDPADHHKEKIEPERIQNVRQPSIGVFRSTIGVAPRPAVVICPGGGYSWLSILKEGEEVARWLNSLGIDAYVLKYRMKEFGFPAPLQDVTSAIRYLRLNAHELEIDPGKIGVMGFSAGGHVAAMCTTLYDSPEAISSGESPVVSARPDFSILAYPVISMRHPVTHSGSRQNLLGQNPDPELLARLSLASQVDESTPPVFLMHTAEDSAVPVENSLEFAAAMAAYDRPFALHIFPEGPHGMGMRPGFGEASFWPTLLAGWLKELGAVGVIPASMSIEAPGT